MFVGEVVLDNKYVYCVDLIPGAPPIQPPPHLPVLIIINYYVGCALRGYYVYKLMPQSYTIVDCEVFVEYSTVSVRNILQL